MQSSAAALVVCAAAYATSRRAAPAGASPKVYSKRPGGMGADGKGATTYKGAGNGGGSTGLR